MITAVGVERTAATAMVVAWSSGLPVEIAGNATDRAPT